MSTASSSIKTKAKLWLRYGGAVLALLVAVLVLWSRLRSMKPAVADAKAHFREAKELTEVEVEIARRKELRLKLRLERILADPDVERRRAALHELYMEVMR